MQINIHESDPPLSQLLKRVLAGEEVIISSDEGKPIAKLVSCEESSVKKRRTLGGWEGKVWIADDFDEIPEEIAEAFGIE